MTEQNLSKLFPVRVVPEYFVQTPHPAQQIALSLNNEELLYGGAAGGGKSSFQLMAALQYVDVPGYSALLVRRTWPDLNSPGAILDRFKEWMADKPVHKGEMGRLWTFPSGAKIQFGYAQRPDAKYKFQGAEYQFIGIDEATQFEPEIYDYLMTRLRKPTVPCLICANALTRYYDGAGKVRFRHSTHQPGCGGPVPDPVSIQTYAAAPDGTTIFDVPLRMRTTANPGGRSHQFFYNRFIKPHPENRGDRVFIPAALRDNPSLNREEYEKTLSEVSTLDRERLLNGNWEIMDAGDMFDRGDFEFVSSPPQTHEIKSRVRFWDLAASTEEHSDYSAGALCSVTHDGRWFVEDIKRVRMLGPDVERLMRKTAIEDGLDVRVFAEQEPGASGKAYIAYLTRQIMAGFQFKGIRSTGAKKDRAGAFASQVSNRNVFLVEGKWNVPFMDEAVMFPKGAHDDQVDAVASAFIQQVANRRPLRLIV
jgi:predicted phage terminase large subunit-like protein